MPDSPSAVDTRITTGTRNPADTRNAADTSGPRRSRRHGARRSTAPIEVRRLGRVGYREAFDLQHRLAGERADGTLDHDVLLLLEHPAVFTAGRRTEDSDRPTGSCDVEVIDVDRGGKITWHGPGQLVAYPIVALTEPLDVVDYVRRLEEALMGVCHGFGVPTLRVDGRSGVWVDADAPDPLSPGRPQRKIAAIGIRVARGVALHGIALNCDADLRDFEAIVPCGIPDAGVTSLTIESGRAITIPDVIDAAAAAIVAALDGPQPRLGSEQ